MKAKDIEKQPMPIEKIFDQIKVESKNHNFKMFIPHFVLVDDSTKLELIDLGYKVYYDNWDGIIRNALIIEW